MYFIEIVDLLKEKYDISIVDHNKYSSIFDIGMIGDGLPRWNEHTLYIGDFSNLEAFPRHPIMLINTAKEIPMDKLPSGSCLAVIDSKDEAGIAMLAKNILFEDLKSQAILFEIAQEALNDGDLVTLMDNAASLIGNALILVDTRMNILLYSSSFEIMDPLWADNVKRGTYSHEFMRKVKRSKDMQEWDKSGDETRVITLEGDLQPKLVTRITQKGHVVGALIMIAHHSPINGHHLKQLPQIGKILFNRFSKGDENGTYKSYYNAILFHLLSGDNLSDTYDLLNLSTADFPKEMRVIVVRFIKRVQNRYLKINMAAELERIFPRGYPVHYKNYIGILVENISPEQEKELSILSTGEDINIGISWPFTDILDFRSHFYQAVASIKQAQSFGEINKVFDYTAYSFYDLLYNYAGKIALYGFCHPALSILKEYDVNNNTELYLTLETYINSSLNLKVTAERLFLHRNSVTYRLNKIIEVTSLNLEDVDTIYSLVDSFRIQKFLNTRENLNL